MMISIRLVKMNPNLKVMVEKSSGEFVYFSIVDNGIPLISALLSKYLMWHMRRQLAFDIWPLALAVLMISMFERGKLLDPEK